MGETNGDNKKKTAREIIENYNGPKGADHGSVRYAHT